MAKKTAAWPLIIVGWHWYLISWPKRQLHGLWWWLMYDDVVWWPCMMMKLYDDDVVWWRCIMMLYGDIEWWHCMMTLYDDIEWWHCMMTLYDRNYNGCCMVIAIFRYCMLIDHTGRGCDKEVSQLLITKCTKISPMVNDDADLITPMAK